MKIGLFFGSFNPIHIGHMIIASYMVEISDLDRVRFVVSPQNPFKNKQSLLDEYDRLHLVQLATEEDPRLEVSGIEFDLARPSFTIDTLTYLKELEPETEFSIIMGSDNLQYFHKWKNFEQILKHQQILVYRRTGYQSVELEKHPNVHFFELPLLDISASFIRKEIATGRDMRYFLPSKVYEYIQKMGYFSA